MKSPLWIGVAIVLPCVASGLFHVWTRTTTLELGYALSRESDRHARLLEENRALRIEAARLRSPDRLRKIAPKLGLYAPRSDQVLDLRGTP